MRDAGTEGSGTKSLSFGFNWGYPSGYYADSRSFNYSWTKPRKIVLIDGCYGHANAGERSSSCNYYLTAACTGGDVTLASHSASGTNCATNYAPASFTGPYINCTGIYGYGYAQGNADVSNGGATVYFTSAWYVPDGGYAQLIGWALCLFGSWGIKAGIIIGAFKEIKF